LEYEKSEYQQLDTKQSVSSSLSEHLFFSFSKKQQGLS